MSYGHDQHESSPGLILAMQEQGLLSEEKAGELRACLDDDWRPAAEVILRQAEVPEEKLLPCVADYVGMPHVSSLSELVVPEAFFERIPPEHARALGLAARSLTDDRLEVAVAFGPDLSGLMEDVAHLFGRPTTCVLAPRREIESAVDRSVRHRPEYLENAADALGQDELTESAAEIERVTDFGELMRRTPVVKLVSLLIAQAVRTGSTDIHFQPLGGRLLVRFRADGILHDVLELPRSAQDAVLSRIKVLGKMDIAERRAPQDGRASFRYADREIDVRMSVVPTSEGERAALRLFDKHAKLLDLKDLGLDESNLARFDELIVSSHGMVLVTGPTGSGKTTTLYAALGQINSPEHNIITIEDPVEYKLPGISQIQVIEKKNVTFASMLRSVLRQDPDIIMIGEIRDAETAAIAVQSALTGHLVFSTLHTNDSAGAVARLLDLKAEPFLISSALLGVLAQRLVRRVCPACGAAADPSQTDLESLGITPELAATATFRKGPGCDECLGTGYRGRLGIFELLVMDERLRERVRDRAASTDIRDEGLRRGLTLLRADGAAKAMAGITTVDEVLRVTQREAT